MPESRFYAKAVAGWPALLARLIALSEAPADRLAIILGDTARLASLGTPEENPSAAELLAWSHVRPPLWAAKTALFLLVQMPRRPAPESEEERAAWAYLWLRLRPRESLVDAIAALPEYLRTMLADDLDQAWRDQISQRLV
ncbi:hypothetical protein [Halotalea alkalilenta]|uniref:hypothetical protein n=1 Tax=Halotalea alkalilenta TaxID=376489 RepID=UPI0004846F87|nr:hypothetical protein [Halotalea alkalilenta]